MLVDSMIPEATSKSGRVAGLATTLEFRARGGAFDGLGLGGVDSRPTGGLAFDIEKCLH